MSDYKGAALMLDVLPKTTVLIGDRGYDADRLRQAIAARSVTPCIPSKIYRKVPIPHDAALYRSHHKIEIMFGRRKDWRRIQTPTMAALTPSRRHRARRHRHLLAVINRS